MYRVAVSGLRHGHIRSIIQQLAGHPRIKVVAIAEENRDEGGKILAGTDLKISHDNLENLMNEVEFDILAVGDVYAKRGQQVIIGLEAGKNIICDKPLCTKEAELEHIEKLSAEKNLSVIVALSLRYCGPVQTARKLVLAGEIGTIATIVVTGTHPLSYRSGRPDWYFEEGLHGGTINDLMIHGVDALNWITGHPVEEVVAARAWNVELPEKPFFQDAAQGLLQLAGGTGVIFDVSYKAAQGHKSPWTFHFWGTGGEMVFDTSSTHVAVRRHKEPEKQVPAECMKSNFAHSLLAEINQERDTILSTRECLNSTRQTLAIQKAADHMRHRMKI